MKSWVKEIKSIISISEEKKLKFTTPEMKNIIGTIMTNLNKKFTKKTNKPKNQITKVKSEKKMIDIIKEIDKNINENLENDLVTISRFDKKSPFNQTFENVFDDYVKNIENEKILVNKFKNLHKSRSIINIEQLSKEFIKKIVCNIEHLKRDKKIKEKLFVITSDS
jgi:hypothetical protein